MQELLLRVYLHPRSSPIKNQEIHFPFLLIHGIVYRLKVTKNKCKQNVVFLWIIFIPYEVIHW